LVRFAQLLFQDLNGSADTKKSLPHRRHLLLEVLQRSLTIAELGLQFLESLL
jgi:hypothetical protein